MPTIIKWSLLLLILFISYITSMEISRKHSEVGLWINEGNENYTKLGGQTKPLEGIWGWGEPIKKFFLYLPFSY